QGDQEQHDIRGLQVTGQKGRQSEAGCQNFKRFTDDKNGALAEDVRQLSGVAGEEDEWHDEDGADDGEFPARMLCRHHVHGEQGNNDLEQVVVKSAEKLSPQKGLKAWLIQSATVRVIRHWVLHVRRARTNTR